MKIPTGLKLSAISMVFIVAMGCDSSEKKKESYSVIGTDSILTITSNGAKEIYKIKNGGKTGVYKLYSQKGVIKESGILNNGKRDGVVKYYNDSLLNVEYYEKGVKIFDLDKTDFIFDTVNLDVFQVCVPKFWMKSIYRDNSLFLMSQKKCDSTQIFCPVFSVTKEKTDLNLEAYVLNAFKLMDTGSGNVKILRKNDIELDDLKIIQVRYIMKREGEILGFQSGFLKIKDMVYILTGTALNGKTGEFLKYDSLFEDLIISIQGKLPST